MSHAEVDLASDLEWMLLSGQVEAEMLIDRLVDEEFAHLYRMARSVLEAPDASQEAAAEVLARAVLSAHEYDGQLSAREWLCAIAEEVCQVRQGRAFHHTFAGYVRKFFSNGEKTPGPRENDLRTHSLPRDPAEGHDEARVDFSPGELNEIATDIEANIKKRRKQLSRWTSLQQIVLIALLGALIIFVGKSLDERIPTRQPPTADKGKAIATQVVHVKPAPAATATSRPFPEGAVVYRVERTGTLDKLAIKVGVDAEILSSLNGIPPDQELDPGQRVMIGVGEPPAALVTPTPVTPAPLPEPLTISTTFEEVFERIQESRKNWSTLWADAIEMDYGPNGFANPPEVKRYQVWLSQPSYDQVISGDLDGELFSVWRRVSEQVYAVDFDRGKRSLLTTYTGPLGFTAELGNMLFPERHRYPAEGKMIVLGIEPVAGRESLVLDWHYDEPSDQSDQTGYMGRYWVDTSTGAILRRQQFIQGNPELLLKDILVLNIAFDINFSNALFDPNEPFPTNFASDYRGTPEAPEATVSVP